MKKYLIIDGYNLLYEWFGQNLITEVGLEEARERLTDAVANYSGFTDYTTIIVFDAYATNVDGVLEIQQDNIKIVYTDKNQTADSYIEKLVYAIRKPDTIKVVTSDASIQSITIALGGERMPSRQFVLEVNEMIKKQTKEYKNKRDIPKNKLTDYLDEEVLDILKNLRKGEM